MNRPLAVPPTWPEQPFRASAMPHAAATMNAFISSLLPRKTDSIKTRPAEAGLVGFTSPRLSAFADHRIAHQVRVAHVLDQFLHVFRWRRREQADDVDRDHACRQAEHARRY